jgi:hypothetical protein
MFSFDVRNLAGEIAHEYAKRQVGHLVNFNALTADFLYSFFSNAYYCKFSLVLLLLSDCFNLCIDRVKKPPLMISWN